MLYPSAPSEPKTHFDERFEKKAKKAALIFLFAIFKS